MTKFELSAYGVEEMTQEELQNIDGGIGWIVVLGIAAAAVGIVSGAIQIYEYFYNSETGEAKPAEAQTKMYREGYIEAIGVDSIVVAGPFGGTYKLYGADYVRIH